MKKFLLINNIPTPYRTFMFNKFWEIGKKYDIDFKVAFQARKEKRRSWKPEDFDMKFPYYISSGILTKRPVEFFNYNIINIDIIVDLLFNEYDWVMMAPFMSITNWITTFLHNSKTIKLLWVESNLSSTKHIGLGGKFIKKILLTPYDALVCPGQKAVDYLTFISKKMKEKPILWLPNIVDTSLFKIQVQRLRENRVKLRQELGFDNNKILLLGIGQFVKRKGFDAIIKALTSITKENYCLILAGDGPELPRYKKFIDINKMSDRVVFTGSLSEENVIKLMACVDCFIHTARKDPSPLVVIEACNAGLPLVISKQTGNVDEAIIENSNGFTFDVNDENEVLYAIQRIVSTPLSSLVEMGKVSSEISEKRFDPDKVIDKFYRNLLAL